MNAFGAHRLYQRLLAGGLFFLLATGVTAQTPERGPLVLSIEAIGTGVNPVIGRVPFFSRQLKAETSFFSAAPPAGSGLAPAKTISDVTAVATWASSDPTVVSITVDATGVHANLGANANACTSMAGCPVTITATYGRLHASLDFTIFAPTGITVVNISKTPTNPLPDGEFQLLAADAIYADGFNCVAPAPPTPPPPLGGCYATKFVAFTTDNSAAIAIDVKGVPGLAQAAGTSGTANISCTLAGTPVITCTSLALTAAPPVLVFVFVTPHNSDVGLTKTVQYIANGHYSDGSVHALPNGSDTVTWSVSGNTPPDGGNATITASGLATGTSDGTVFVTAIPSASGTCPLNDCVAGLNIGLNTASQSVSLSPNPLTIPKGETMPLTATGIFGDGKSRDVSKTLNWSSSSATTAKVDIAGNVTALGAPMTSATITGTVGACPGFLCGTATVNVASPVLQSIAITPNNPTVPLGFAQQFTATGTYSDNSTQVITGSATWASSDNTKLCFTSCVLNTQPVTLAPGQAVALVASGSFNVQATLGAVSSPFDMVTLAPAALASIKVTPKNPSVPNGAQQTFTAKGTYTDGTKFTLPYTGDPNHAAAPLIWSSSNAGAATISNTPGPTFGQATAVGTSGSSTIMATSGVIAGSTTMTVTPAALKSISVTPLNPSAIGQSATQQFDAMGTYTDGSMKDVTTSVTWNSSDSTVATIDSSGLATASATKTGTITISATDPVSGVNSNNATLSVVTRTLQTITVGPSPASVNAGFTVQFTATGNYNVAPPTQDLTSAVMWSSSNPAIASVNSSGLATGVVQSGTAINITATDPATSTSGFSPLTVNPPVLQSISVTPLSTVVGLNSTQQYTATGNYSDGSTANLTDLVTWSTASGGTVTSIDATGLLTGTGLSQDPDTVSAACSASIPGCSVQPGTATVSVVF